MLFDKNAAKFAPDAQRAEDDSLTLWRELRCAFARTRTEDTSCHEFEDVESVSLNLAGRYRVADGSEYSCEIVDISPRGIHIDGPRSAGLGNWCTANISSVGIVEGVVIRAQVESFTLGVIAPPRRLRRLAQRLSWQLQRKKSEVTERRSSERIEMNHAKAVLEASDGRAFSCDIFDISAGGAALHLSSDALYFWIDQPVKLDERAGRVLRHFPGGIVIKFD